MQRKGLRRSGVKTLLVERLLDDDKTSDNNVEMLYFQNTEFTNYTRLQNRCRMIVLCNDCRNVKMLKC